MSTVKSRTMTCSLLYLKFLTQCLAQRGAQQIGVKCENKECISKFLMCNPPPQNLVLKTTSVIIVHEPVDHLRISVYLVRVD